MKSTSGSKGTLPGQPRLPVGERCRIVFVIDTLQIGGAERHLLRLVDGLRESGDWDPQVYCLSRSGRFLSAMESLGVPVSGVPDRWSRSPGRATRSAWHLIRWLRRERPAIVHCYLTQSLFLGAVGARLARVPCVVTTRRLVHSYRGGKLVAYRVAMAITDLLSDAVIAVSRSAADQAVAEGTPAKKIYVVRNAVSIPREPPRTRESRGALRIGTMGRLHEQKGHLDLIAAAQLVVARVPGATFEVAGDGPDRFALQAQVNALGLERHFRFLGDIDDVSGFLDRLDIFVLPSRYEGLPNALLEAMAAGIPSVATDIEGVREVIDGEENGLLVPPNNPQALAASLIRLATDLELRVRLSESGRRRVEADFAPECEVHETASVYRAVLEAHIPYQKWLGRRGA